MRKIIVSALVILFILLTSPTAYAEDSCKGLDGTNKNASLTVTPLGDNKFRFSGTIKDCDISSPAPYLTIRIIRLDGTVSPINTLAPGGVFNKEATVHEKGEMKVDLFYLTGVQSSPTTPLATFTVVAEKAITCGSEVGSNEGNKCPAECPSAADPAGRSNTLICTNTPQDATNCVDVNSAPTCNPDKYGIVPSAQACNNSARVFKCPLETDTICRVANVDKWDVYCQKALPTPIPPTPVFPPCEKKNTDGSCSSFPTAFGNIATDPLEFIQRIYGILLGISGGIAILLIIYSGYQLMTSAGDKEKVQAARDRITSAIVGLLFLIFSMVILQVIGVDILNLPGFGG